MDRYTRLIHHQISAVTSTCVLFLLVTLLELDGLGSIAVLQPKGISAGHYHLVRDELNGGPRSMIRWSLLRNSRLKNHTSG
jgi:hypothetical protein